MQDNVLRLLRYNMPRDKKVFLEFKNNFDIAIFNANLVVHSSKAIADLISTYKREFIIDPQTHLLMHDPSQLQSNKTQKIKTSIIKYLDQMPFQLKSIIIDEERGIRLEDLEQNMNELVDKTYDFQYNYVESYVVDKEYNKYLEFEKIKIRPKYLIAPYFMIRNINDAQLWININRDMLLAFINKKNTIEIAAELILEKNVLLNDFLISNIIDSYAISGYEYIFIWIDDFKFFKDNIKYYSGFKKLIDGLNNKGKKPINLYGGFGSILLCHKNSSCKMYGVSQSTGYGESRPVTPIGGGLPTNKYYFFNLHDRLKLQTTIDILLNFNFFDNENNSASELAEKYYKEICDCKQCKEIIGDNIENFYYYNDSKSFTIKFKNGNEVNRNRPTPDSEEISARHFMYCKVKEWELINNSDFNDIINNFCDISQKYNYNYKDIKDWCDFFGKK